MFKSLRFVLEQKRRRRELLNEHYEWLKSIQWELAEEADKLDGIEYEPFETLWERDRRQEITEHVAHIRQMKRLMRGEAI